MEIYEKVPRPLDELTRARFEQHLLPDEETLRKILRYEPMLNREFDRWLDRLERLQKGRRANGFRGSEPPDDSLPGDGKIVA